MRATRCNPDISDIHHITANVSKIVGSHNFKFGGEFSSSNFQAFYNNASVDLWRAADSESCQSGRYRKRIGLLDPQPSRLCWPPQRPRNGALGRSHGILLPGSVESSVKNSRSISDLRYDRTFQPPYGASDSVGENGGIETGAYDMQRGKYVVQVQVPLCSQRGKAPCIPDPGLPANVEYSSTGKIYKDTTDNWQPRVGLAYRLSNETALRGSFGVFFENWAGVTQTAQNYEGGWPDVAQQLANNMNNRLAEEGPLPNRSGQNPFPEGLFPAPTPFNQVLWYMDPNHKNAYSMQWNMGVQHQLNSTHGGHGELRRIGQPAVDARRLLQHRAYSRTR